MKRISVFLVLVMLVGLFPCGMKAFAESEEGFEFFYDFENYSAGIGSKVMPDLNWGYYTGTAGRQTFGSYYDAAENNTSMRVGNMGEPLLFFGRNVTDGKLHVSFDAKFSASGRKALVLFYDGRSGDDATTLGKDYYSKTFFLNSPEYGKINYYIVGPGSKDGGGMTGWNSLSSEVEYTPNEWHRFDIITNEISESTANANYYMDGKLINATPVYFSKSKGFKAFGIRCEGTGTESDYFLFDNLKVRHYYGESYMRADIIGSNRVPLENGELQVRLSEDVDPQMLTESNISINNTIKNELVTDFEVLDATKNTFRIKFNQVLSSGIYTLLLSSNVRGGILQSRMLRPVEFRTEYQYVEKNIEHINDNFNDYEYLPVQEQGILYAIEAKEQTVEDEVYSLDSRMELSIFGGAGSIEILPEGWINIDNLAQTYAQSVAGRSGEAGDFAFGFVNPAESRTQSRFVRELPIEIFAGAEYSIQFDILYENMYWYTYLLEDGDLNDNNPDRMKNIAIASTNTSGNIYYAQSRSASQVKLINSALSVPKNEWHTVNLTVTPQKDNTAIYTVSVDDGEEYIVQTERAFYSNPTIGIGFGYIPTKDKNSKLYIDNVRVNSNMQLLRPEPENIYFLDYEGSVVNDNDQITSMLHKIVIDFNTVITEASIYEGMQMYEDGKVMDCNRDIEVIDRKSRAVITLNRLLLPGKGYQLDISQDISSKYDSDVKSTLSISKRFRANYDAAFKMFSSTIDQNNKKCFVRFAKNNDAQGKYTLAVAGYKTVARIIEGVEKQVDELVGIRYVPVEVYPGTKGVIEYEMNLDFYDECAKTEIYLWTYPELQKVLFGAGNKIN